MAMRVAICNVLPVEALRGTQQEEPHRCALRWRQGGGNIGRWAVPAAPLVSTVRLAVVVVIVVDATELGATHPRTCGVL